MTERRSAHAAGVQVRGGEAAREAARGGGGEVLGGRGEIAEHGQRGVQWRVLLDGVHLRVSGVGVGTITAGSIITVKPLRDSFGCCR